MRVARVFDDFYRDGGRYQAKAGRTACSSRCRVPTTCPPPRRRCEADGPSQVVQGSGDAAGGGVQANLDAKSAGRFKPGRGRAMDAASTHRR